MFVVFNECNRDGLYFMIGNITSGLPVAYACLKNRASGRQLARNHADAKNTFEIVVPVELTFPSALKHITNKHLKSKRDNSDCNRYSQSEWDARTYPPLPSYPTK